MAIAQICADRGIAPGSTKGAAQHLRGIAAGLTERGHQVTSFCARQPEGSFPVAVHPLGSFDTQRADASDVIYERYSLGHLRGLELAQEAGRPFVLEVNAPLVEEARIHRPDTVTGEHRRAEERLLAQADLVITVSTTLAEWVDEQRSGPTVTLGNGFEPSWFRARAHACVTHPLVFLGHPKPWHGANALPDLLVALAGLGSKPDLLVIGGGAGADSLLRRAESLGVAAQITVTGPLPPERATAMLAHGAIGLAPYPAMANFYFCPLKIIDYLAAGLPVVSTNQGDILQLVADSGIVVDARCWDDYVDAVHLLLNDPLRCAELGRRGRVRSHASMTWDHVAGRTECLIAGLTTDRLPLR